MYSPYETFYNTTEKTAKATRAFREGLLIIDEVAEIFTKEIDRVLNESKDDYAHTEAGRNGCIRTMYRALAALLDE